jgi:predicted DNA-binding protein YlxM (UPF0122 family)
MADVLSVPAAADEKSCSRQTIYNALDRGALNELRTGKTRLVIRDEAYEEWEVEAKYREKSRIDDYSDSNQ